MQGFQKILMKGTKISPFEKKAKKHQYAREQYINIFVEEKEKNGQYSCKRYKKVFRE